MELSLHVCLPNIPCIYYTKAPLSQITVPQIYYEAQMMILFMCALW